MAKSLAGLDLELAITAHLKDIGFRIQKEEEWDHNNKIDFVVTKFPGYPKSVSLGVQVTAWCGNGSKLGEFVAKNAPGSGNMVVHKAIYLEIGEFVDMNKGGAGLVAQILGAFQFDEQFVNAKVWGATILAKPDSIAYRFFDPRKTVPTELPPNPIIAGKTVPVSDLKGSADLLQQKLGDGKRELEGTLHSYYAERRCGFIDAQDGNTYYLNVSNVQDAALVGDLNAMMKSPGRTPLQYHVLFENGGKKRDDKMYPEARNVRLMLRC